VGKDLAAQHGYRVARHETAPARPHSRGTWKPHQGGTGAKVLGMVIAPPGFTDLMKAINGCGGLTIECSVIG